MAALEEIKVGARVRGLSPTGVATVKAVEWFGEQGVQVLYLDDRGVPQQALLYRDDESRLALDEATTPWSFDADGDLLRLASEAYRIHLAWLFDPYIAITTSTIDPLPHQISAVYEEMLPRQPMRFLLADDPGAGKTIMAGLLIKELLIRGDLQRCLIVSPGSLTEQWQDELHEKFDLDFDLLTRDMIEASRTANPFEQKNLLIARLDQMSRSDEVQEKLKAGPEWDLIVCDEAHRMSAHYMGGEVKYTKRYRLGQLLGERCRNLLLMTATPHNGHEDDFQLFLALLDGDRFEGRYREGVHTADPSDLMRRLIKEDLYTFDGRRLFPERRSHTISYPLCDAEASLYHAVSAYVQTEMNRAERLAAKDQQRRINVGFALMTLQRRLASSPEAIFRSIERRREKLEGRLRDERIQLRGKQAGPLKAVGPNISPDEWDELDEEAPQDEREELEQQLVDNATAAQTIAELEVEIAHLKELEKQARALRHSGQDAKWNELTTILDDPLMVGENGQRRKLVIFTEFRDTLTYIAQQVRKRLGRPDAVVEIHGGIAREERRKVVHAFMNDPDVLVLIANDAAGEGVNLQRAHLMVNYDLPWNPNRLEQRFGRIHRIGQTEVCHLWNLIGKDTREADVYVQLLEKLDDERKALGGKVFDVLGQLFEAKPLRELLIEAVRYGDRPEVKAKIQQQIADAVDRRHLEELIKRRALVDDAMDVSHIDAIRLDMERARARRLQPHFIQSFFLAAFDKLGGKAHRRETGRWEISHVPQVVRDRDRLIGTGAPVGRRYERVCFDKSYISETPRALLVCPGNPLLDTTIDLVLEQHRGLLKQGAVLIDENDGSEQPRLLFYLEHAVQDGRKGRGGTFQVISQRLQFVEVGPDGTYRDAGMAPYLDYRGATKDERASLRAETDAAWLKDDWERKVMSFALRELVPKHIDEVKRQRLPLIDKVEEQVKARLIKEINFWDRRAQDLKAQEAAGKQTRLPSRVAEERANRLSDRMQARLAALKEERAVSPQPPRVVGGALVIPAGLLRKYHAPAAVAPAEVDAAARAEVERLAMEAVFAAERALGREPRDVSVQKGRGHDIESRDPKTGDVYFIEVKGRVATADGVTLTRTEVLCGLNVPDRFRLAIVEVENGAARPPVYVTNFDWGQPGFAQTTSTYHLKTMLAQGGPPR
ncbi:helicase-related protein [Nannocystis sp. SCPEA4]|uniref:helicase-related protein n=1 Tax=Nannocystis sp. SCPEA4 TaxID=2996787 RepID=UPI002272008E|nr:helicase-related protein [Nannocystis sp. SCPEA4]MCY1060709.1 helicase-related protein [Nannocystis sp. SCPEA4]